MEKLVKTAFSLLPRVFQYFSTSAGNWGSVGGLGAHLLNRFCCAGLVPFLRMLGLQLNANTQEHS